MGYCVCVRAFVSTLSAPLCMSIARFHGSAHVYEDRRGRIWAFAEKTLQSKTPYPRAPVT